MRICIRTDNVFFRKPTFNSLYDPFGSPSSGGQKPQEREDVAGSDFIKKPQPYAGHKIGERK